ncbi:MAG: diguanylate cyclase [Armatimonadota bacterium]|nr:diguanylate cyclase [Armatimonadota bacterium]
MNSNNQPNNNVEILVVDDSRTQAVMLRNLLQAQGYQVTVAANGREALEAAHRQKPALIISDIVMPVMDGYAMCRALKQDAALRGTPVILLTSLSDPADIIRGLEANADYYLTKPYNHAYLLATLDDILQNPAWRHGERHEHSDGGIEVILAGQRHIITARRQQMLNLLLSTYGNAVQQNRELIQTKQALETLNQQLREQAQRIEQQQQELQQANARLHELAMTDGLTGLKNHRAFKEKLGEEFQRASRYDQAISLVLLDIDKFKLYNDTFGHPAGDEVLKSVARLLETTVRETDFVARYGGEEFAVLLLYTDYATAVTLAERLRLAIEAAPWPERAITASFGVATMTAATTSSALLLEEADKALYHSKSNGANRVTHASDLDLPLVLV